MNQNVPRMFSSQWHINVYSESMSKVFFQLRKGFPNQAPPEGG